MKKKITFLLLLFFTSFVIAKAKPKIAVADFKVIGSKVSNAGVFVANKVNDLCATIKTVDVIDRTHLDQILQEQNLSLTGLVDNFGQNKVGKISGLNYLIVGDVSQCSVTRNLKEFTKKIKQKKGSYIYKKEKKWEWTGTGTVQLRILDVVSGEILYSKTKTGVVQKYEDYIPHKNYKKILTKVRVKKKARVKKIRSSSKIAVSQVDFNRSQSDLIFQALSKAVSYYKNDFYNLFRPTGYIIGIMPYKGNKYKVLLDVGENFGIKKGSKFLIIQKGKTIVHPVTKELIQTEDVVVGKIKIKEVASETSYAIVNKKMANVLKIGQAIKATKVGGCLF